MDVPSGQCVIYDGGTLYEVGDSGSFLRVPSGVLRQVLTNIWKLRVSSLRAVLAGEVAPG